MMTFDHILLLGRPAAGKSEFIDFMKQLPDGERAENLHIGRFEELDDFVWIWEKFVEDNLWEEAGYPRLYSGRYGDNFGLLPEAGKLLDLMFVKFNRETAKYGEKPGFYEDGTLFIEFSRGGEEGYTSALSKLSEDILKKAAILYIDVSFEESWRRNVARYEAKKKHSILAHMVPRETMDCYYRTTDWQSFTGGRKDGFVEVRGLNIPFVTMPNEPELKEPGPLAERYGAALSRLWELKIE